MNRSVAAVAVRTVLLCCWTSSLRPGSRPVDPECCQQHPLTCWNYTLMCVGQCCLLTRPLNLLGYLQHIEIRTLLKLNNIKWLLLSSVLITVQRLMACSFTSVAKPQMLIRHCCKSLYKFRLSCVDPLAQGSVGDPQTVD